MDDIIVDAFKEAVLWFNQKNGETEEFAEC